MLHFGHNRSTSSSGQLNTVSSLLGVKVRYRHVTRAGRASNLIMYAGVTYTTACNGLNADGWLSVCGK